MNLIEQIKADREAGTPGPWVQGGTLYHTSAFDFYDPFGPNGGSVACVIGEPEGEANAEEMSNARRIARVPDMEAALLAAEELASVAAAMTGRKPSPLTGGRLILEVDCENLATALAAYRKATGAAQ